MKFLGVAGVQGLWRPAARGSGDVGFWCLGTPTTGCEGVGIGGEGDREPPMKESEAMESRSAESASEEVTRGRAGRKLLGG